MSGGGTGFLRTIAAALMCLSGTGQVAALWLRELTGAALGDALLGAVYLIIGIGLFGQSRFSLFLGIAVPAAASGALLHAQPGPDPVHNLRIATDGVVALCCAIVLWRVRNNPSV